MTWTIGQEVSLWDRTGFLGIDIIDRITPTGQPRLKRNTTWKLDRTGYGGKGIAVYRIQPATDKDRAVVKDRRAWSDIRAIVDRHHHAPSDESLTQIEARIAQIREARKVVS